MLGTESITDGEAVRGEHLVGGDGPESSGPGGGSGDARVAAASAGGLGAGAWE